MNLTDIVSHPSRNQVEVLIEFLEKYPNFAEGFSKVPCVRNASRKAWKGLTLKLNSLGGCVKTWKQWIKYWSDKKSAVKRKATLRFRARNKYGGGFESVVELSEMEQRIVALIGGSSFSTSDNHFEINPITEPTMNPAILSDIPSLTIEREHEPSCASLIDVDVTPIVDEAHSPRVRPPSPLQQPIPSRSGQYPGQGQLDLGGVQAISSIQFDKITERFLRLQEQRLELDRCKYERTYEALNAIAEAIKLLVEAIKLLVAAINKKI